MVFLLSLSLLLLLLLLLLLFFLLLLLHISHVNNKERFQNWSRPFYKFKFRIHLQVTCRRPLQSYH